MNPSLFSPEGLAGILFLILIIVTFVGAVIATSSHKLVRAVCGLAICFLGVAGLYYFLNSPFVAMMQLLIYIGAVCITIAFAIMLADPEEAKAGFRIGGLTGWIAASCGGVVAYFLAKMGIEGNWPASVTEKFTDGSVKSIGNSLLTQYSMAFELVSVVLLVAIIGSLVLARVGRDKESC